MRPLTGVGATSIGDPKRYQQKPGSLVLCSKVNPGLRRPDRIPFDCQSHADTLHLLFVTWNVT